MREEILAKFDGRARFVFADEETLVRGAAKMVEDSLLAQIPV
jgi:hypothetical protein